MFGPLVMMVLATLGVLWLVNSAATQQRAEPVGLATFMTAGALLGLLGAALLLRGAWALAIPAAAGAIACARQYQRLARLARPTHTHVSGMQASEARAILGVKEDATRDDIKAAHRKLIDQLHPDKGGTDYLAAQINAAKDVLLKGFPA